MAEPIRLLIHGASGRMGRALLRLSAADARFSVVAAISRSGASTVAELSAIGRPAILVPLPHALDQDRRRLLHGGVIVAGVGLLAGCGALSLPSPRATRGARIGLLAVSPLQVPAPSIEAAVGVFRGTAGGHLAVVLGRPSPDQGVA